MQQLFIILLCCFCFFPLRGLSIFTRPNELLNAEVLYPNLFAVKKMKYDVYLPPAWESPFFCRWYLKAEIRNQKRTLLSLTSHRQIDYLSKFVDSLYLSCMSVTEYWYLCQGKELLSEIKMLHKKCHIIRISFHYVIQYIFLSLLWPGDF